MAADIAAACGHAKALPDGKWMASCPNRAHGQGHGDRNPSLLIADGERAPLFTCFAGCDRADIVSELRRRGILDGQSEGQPRVERRPTAIQDPDPEAVAEWRQAGDSAGTVVDIYLRSHRGIIIPIPPTIRHAASVAYAGNGYRFPAMVAAVQGVDRKVIAVQVTFLRASDGAKAPLAHPRMTIGALGIGAVRLAKAGTVLGIAEGTEDALAAMQLTGVPTWACLGAGRMHRVAIPDSVRELHVFADDDEPGRAAADRTAALHSANLGRKVLIRRPPEGCKDWGDFIHHAGRSVA